MGRGDAPSAGQVWPLPKHSISCVPVVALGKASVLQTSCVVVTRILTSPSALRVWVSLKVCTKPCPSPTHRS